MTTKMTTNLFLLLSLFLHSYCVASARVDASTFSPPLVLQQQQQQQQQKEGGITNDALGASQQREDKLSLRGRKVDSAVSDAHHTQKLTHVRGGRLGANTDVHDGARGLKEENGNSGNVQEGEQTEGDSDSSGIDKAKESASDARENLDEVLGTAPKEWTKGQKVGVAVGVTAAVLIALCIFKKFICCCC